MSAVAAPLMPTAVRLLTAFAGLGAAICTFGLASNVLAQTTVQGIASATAAWPAALAWPAAAAVAVWAIALTVWAIGSFRAQRPIRPLLAVRILAGITVLNIVALLAQFLQRHVDGTLLATFVLELVILGSLGWLSRKGLQEKSSQGNIDSRSTPRGDAPNNLGTPPAGRLLLSMFISALVVSAIATAGLAAGTAGLFSIPHDQMNMDLPGFSSGHHH